MEFVTLLAVPILTALIAPIILEYIKKRIDRNKEEQEQRARTTDKNQELADQLRDELREENVDLKKIIDGLEARVLEDSGAKKEIEKWQTKFYSLKKEHQRLEFDLSLVKKELDFLRRIHEEYLAIKERADRECQRSEDDRNDG